jgi:hypothetical protein
MTGGVDRTAARLAAVLVGIMALEGALFRQIIPIAVAGAFALWEAIAPGRGPAPWLVRFVGRPPTAWISVTEQRVGQGVLAALCAAAVVIQADGAHAASWIAAGIAGVLGILAAIIGRPAPGVRSGRERRER